MTPTRPDLNALPADARAYIEFLEESLADAESAAESGRDIAGSSEAPTTSQVITISRSGQAKRTPRHLYSRQRRGGMGVFDLDSGEDDPPAFLLVADVSDRLLVWTDRNRFFHLAVADLPETPVRGKGEAISRWISLQADENLAVVIPDGGGTNLQLLSDRGWVRKFSRTQLPHLKVGSLVEVRAGHRPVAACWSSGGDDLFVVSRTGQAIRFSERQVPISGGCLGIRLDPDDECLAVAAVQEESGVFLVGDDGKGTVRLMAGFRTNKSPGAGGKVAMKAERLLCAHTVAAGQDALIISALGKIIRFAADDIPAKEGVVQGVHCMSLRADSVTAATVTDAGAPIAEEV
ncbi:MAG: hypothetical protein DWI57_06315 [Chloroflexi bacterium]|nr:MAG: hypothetical protein DWI57_06315 [Chloroflexota bacterium]